MQEIKAISPELNNLFNSIESQADEYAKAFELLAHKIHEFDLNLKTIEQFKNYFSHEFTELAAETKLNITTSLAELDQTLSKVMSLHSQFEQIVSFKESLILLHNQLRGIINSADAIINDFKSKSNLELSSTLNAMKYRVEKEIENLSQKFESKIDFKLKRLETQLLNYDQKIAGVIDYQNKEFRDVKNDLDSLRSKVHNLFKDKEPDSQAKKNKTNSQISQLQDLFEEKLDAIRKHLKQVSDVANDKSQIENSFYAVDDKITNILELLAETKQALKHSNNKIKSLQAITAISAIIALIAVVLSVL